jgi:hypothetical protein
VQVSGLTNITAIAAGAITAWHSGARARWWLGQQWLWSLGNNTTNSSNVPVAVRCCPVMYRHCGGFNHSLAIRVARPRPGGITNLVNWEQHNTNSLVPVQVTG